MGVPQELVARSGARLAVHVDGHPRDRFRFVPDALEVAHRAPERHDHPEIPAHRLAEREHVHRLLVGLDLEEVHHVVAGDHVPRRVGVLVAQRLHRVDDLLLDQAAHPEHDVVEVRELLVEALEGVLVALALSHGEGRCCIGRSGLPALSRSGR